MSDAFFTRAPSTIVTQEINGQTEFTIPFEFLARKFVVVTLLGVDRKVLTLNTDYRFIAVNKIRLEQPAPAGYPRIELRRVTSTTDRLVTFIDGSILRATDLNLAQVQTMHVAEEARDLTSDTIGVNDEGHLDARNRKIVNLANATEPLDAVNLGQLRQFDDSTANNADKAQASAAAAKVSETNAKASENRSIVAEAKAVSSAGTAMTAAADANASKVAAKQSADIVVPLVPTVEKAAADAAQAAADAAQAVQDVKDLGGLPVGSIVMFGTAEIPAGFLSLMYDNPTFNVTEYPDLARLYPDGRLPSYKDRVPEGIGNDITIGQKRAGRVGLTTTMTLVASSVADHVHAAWTDTQGAHQHNYTYLTQGGTYALQDGGLLWSFVNGVTDVQGAHGHNVGIGGAGAHNHTVTGSVGSGRNLVDATGTVFAIKAATGATPDALQVASALSGRVTALEQTIGTTAKSKLSDFVQMAVGWSINDDECSALKTPQGVVIRAIFRRSNVGNPTALVCNVKSGYGFTGYATCLMATTTGPFINTYLERNPSGGLNVSALPDAVANAQWIMVTFTLDIV